jgi:hypothetical protein
MLEIGRLLRIHAMLTEAAQTEATKRSVIALVRAYNSLRSEMLNALAGDDLAELRQECERLFVELTEPPMIDWMREETANEALLNLRKLAGWIQGLIDEQTLETRLRMEAEERVKKERRPPTGFAAE